jgi:hypothetical protein
MGARLICATVVGCAALGGCAPLELAQKADAAFRAALAAQLRGDAERAEAQYRRIIETGQATSAVFNNLAVISVRRHQYIAARHLLARAVAADGRDVVALTNYGVMSYYLADFDERGVRSSTRARSGCAICGRSRRWGGPAGTRTATRATPSRSTRSPRATSRASRAPRCGPAIRRHPAPCSPRSPSTGSNQIQR